MNKHYTILGLRFNRPLFWIAIAYFVFQAALIPLTRWWTPILIAPLLFVWAWYIQRRTERSEALRVQRFNQQWAAPEVDIPKFYRDNPFQDFGLNEKDIEGHRLSLLSQEQLDELDRQGDLPSTRDTLTRMHRENLERFKDTHPPQ